MSTLYGNGQDLDLNLKAGSLLLTSTSQYKVALLSDEFTAQLPSSTATARTGIGIVQSFQSAGSEVVKVRVGGISKAICGASVTAGSWVIPYEGISTTTHYGSIQAVPAIGSSITVGTATASSYSNILGFALENGQTNQAISIVVAPHLYDALLLRQ